MAEIKQFKARDQLTKDQLKAELCEFIDQGDYVIILAHRDKDNVTDFATNLNFKNDRIGLKGIMQDGQEVLFRVAPPVAYEGDVEI